MRPSVLPRLPSDAIGGALRVALRAVLLAVVLLGAGCGGLNDKKDETVGWSANKLYGEAKDAISSKDWDKAVKYLEKLEARYPYGRFAQQAQIEIAYCYYRQNERASAIAAADRFIKLHPNHPNVDYVYYLKGLVNFNEDSGIFARFSSQDMTERDPKGAREAFNTFKDLVTRFPRIKVLARRCGAHEVPGERARPERGPRRALLHEEERLRSRRQPRAVRGAELPAGACDRGGGCSSW